jgi:transposase
VQNRADWRTGHGWAGAQTLTDPGEVGALLRREGLYSSHLTKWKKARESGELAGLRGGKRGPKGR